LNRLQEMELIRRMLKRKTAALLLSLSLSATAGLAAAEAPSKIQVKYDQLEIMFPDQEPILRNQRTLVPIRPIAESLGFLVDWDPTTQMAHFSRNIDQVSVQIGQPIADRNGEKIELDVPALVIQERTMVPLRFIAEALNYQVEWNGLDKIVQISGRSSASPTMPTSPSNELPEESPISDSTLQLGSDILLNHFHDLIKGKKIGLVTNQTGVNSQGISTIESLWKDPEIQLTALYGPEHGIDGKARAGAYVKSYEHPEYHIPVYSLYGETRTPTEEMLKDIDVLLFDVQDVGARWYTYMSTLNYCMIAAKKYDIPVIVLDRPNPVGGTIVEGPVAEDPYLTFVGVDNLPMSHGMTAGELALFFNRKINADVTVIPMEGYTRSMLFQDTGLEWIPTSPMLPTLESVFGYMATGLGEGTGVFQSNFTWIGSKALDATAAEKFANLLNGANLPGVIFHAEVRGTAGGASLEITDPYKFNPAKTGIYALAYARMLTNFDVPKSGKTVVMFDKIMGTNKMGEYLEKGLTPQEIEAKYKPGLEQFKKLRKQYLIYGDKPYKVSKPISSNSYK